MKSDLYNIQINSLSGNAIDLNNYKGKYILFVNLASNCGFTNQYEKLQKLFENHREKLMIIGAPCNQFGKQEPGTHQEIAEFCKLNFGVSFLITEKIDVKGNNQHPLYTWLTSKELNGKKNSSVKWNFQKYLVDPEGNFINYYYSITSPLSTKITKHFI